jgi:hypothetical protein
MVDQSLIRWADRLSWLLLCDGVLGAVALLAQWPNVDWLSLSVALLGMASAVLLLYWRGWAVFGAIAGCALQVLASHIRDVHWSVTAGLALSFVVELPSGVLVVHALALLWLLLACLAAPAYLRHAAAHTSEPTS